MRIAAAAFCLAGGILATLSAGATAQTEGADPRHGQEIVTRECGRCHSIALQGDSPLAAAPAFRDLHQRYPVEDLSEALAEGIVTGHPDMPDFTFSPEDVDDIIAYLKTLEP